MSGDDNKMTEMKPIKSKRSLLERADQRFDFSKEQLRKVEPGTLGDGPLLEGKPARRVPQPRSPKRVPEGSEPPVETTPAEAVASSAAGDVAAQSGEGATPAPGLPKTQQRTAIAPATSRNALSYPRFKPRAPQQTVNRLRLASNGFIDADGATGPLGEEYRVIKRQLLRGTTVPNGRRILITSAQPSEGKTFSSINLALSLAAEHEQSVILVDCDFARQQVPEMLGITTGPGLLDALADSKIHLSDCVIPTDIPELAILPAGRSTPRDAELINSTRMHDLLAMLEAQAPDRLIVFDSMPLLASSSAGNIAQLCGQVLVVVRADVTREAVLRDAIGLIGQHHGISLLLNRVRFTPEGRRFGGYYGEGG
jgi:exopolysaccharide/PEP-CTERM locus tyrosine autokinase